MNTQQHKSLLAGLFQYKQAALKATLRNRVWS